MRIVPPLTRPAGRRPVRAYGPATHRIGRTAAALLTVAAIAVYLPPRAAQAHAILMESQPQVQGTVKAGTLPVWLRFNSRIDAARSRLLLLRPDHSQDTLALERGEGPDRLAAKVQLPSGEYVLRWQVLAVDGHITRGDVPFRVEGP